MDEIHSDEEEVLDEEEYKNYEKLERGISQKYSSSCKQATTQAEILSLLKQKQKHYSY